jgi:hypothetical protein
MTRSCVVLHLNSGPGGREAADTVDSGPRSVVLMALGNLGLIPENRSSLINRSERGREKT